MYSNPISKSVSIVEYIALFKNISFSGAGYILLCNHEYFHCLNQKQTKDYIRSCNKL